MYKESFTFKKEEEKVGLYESSGFLHKIKCPMCHNLHTFPRTFVQKKIALRTAHEKNKLMLMSAIQIKICYFLCDGCYNFEEAGMFKGNTFIPFFDNFMSPCK